MMMVRLWMDPENLPLGPSLKALLRVAGVRFDIYMGFGLSISSATEHGHVPWYSEACSSTLATTYSSGAVGEKQVVTTDLRHSCTSSHTGTSASAPLAAGICALALQANPNLTWRDMQHIVVRTARPQNLVAPDWQTNGVGRNVSHSFGYGLMDAYAMVQLAKNWVTVPEQHKCEISAPHVAKPIPAKSVVVLQLEVKECEGVEVLEHVQAKLTIGSQRRGDLNIQLTSPMGTRVTLLAHRVHDVSRQGFDTWPFMSVHSWGESPFGTWQLEIHNDGRLLGDITAWELTLYGTSTPPAYDLRNGGALPSLHEMFNEEIAHNSIENSLNWREQAENRKDILEVEEQGKKCLLNYNLYQRRCIEKCPEKYYSSLLEYNENAEEMNVVKAQTCLPCHYTCKDCVGSMDYHCTECYPDAKIVHVTSTESYCYPIHIMTEVLSEKWYYRMFTMTYILVIVFAIPAVIYLFVKRRKIFQSDSQEYVNIVTNIRAMEKDIKSAVYTDSE
ncbi:hypothetical protein NQ317_009525 [Molorchus minor]|uniref:P/Homo B domain-containing protein n=1 Tax=Molorchus minor TaxID=1323400 RepID=A0ABQ9IXA2_9CUCU|nr:hypothetical protein NQ317_009525 [Molorchus minor]